VKLLKRARFLRKVRGLNAAAIVRTTAAGRAGAFFGQREVQERLVAFAEAAREADGCLLAQVAAISGHLRGIPERAGTVAMKRSVGTLRKAGAIL